MQILIETCISIKNAFVAKRHLYSSAREACGEIHETTTGQKNTREGGRQPCKFLKRLAPTPILYFLCFFPLLLHSSLSLSSVVFFMSSFFYVFPIGSSVFFWGRVGSSVFLLACKTSSFKLARSIYRSCKRRSLARFVIPLLDSIGGLGLLEDTSYHRMPGTCKLQPIYRILILLLLLASVKFSLFNIESSTRNGSRTAAL